MKRFYTVALLIAGLTVFFTARAFATDVGFSFTIPTIPFTPIMSDISNSSGIAGSPPFSVYATIKGDYDGNGVVDAGDYVLWRKYNGYTYLYEATNTASVIPYFGADGNGDGIVDQLDYDVWRANFGKTATGGPFAFGAGSGSGLGSAAVPEPTSALLVLMGAMMASVSCGRRRSNA